MIHFDSTTALLLIGHGTRNLGGQARFHETVDRVRQRIPATHVEPAFLELCKPSIADAVRQLAKSGARRIVAMPLLLLAAGHARDDLPAQLAAAARPFPDLRIQQAPHLGGHEAIVRLSERRFLEAVEPNDKDAAASARETAWLMVGRGSSHTEAFDEMHRFVELRLARLPVADVYTCFVAAAEPSLEQGIERIAETNAAQIIVQPHLLFPGDVLNSLREAVDSARRRHAARQWRLAPLLGPDPLLVDAILSRAGERESIPS
jgi:sirohydrochlorin cobaltochelatase